jgi:hypothetical protein
MPNFTLENRLGAIPDIQRNFLWEFLIPNINVMTNNIIDTESLIIHTKTALIPGRSVEDIESFFMGMKQIFPGRVTFPNKMAIGIDEDESQIIHKGLYAWMQKQFDVDPDSATAGYSQVPTKRLMCTDVILRCYKYNGEKMENDSVLTNCRPSAIEDVNLDMAGNEKVNYSVTFTYDYWLLKKA